VVLVDLREPRDQLPPQLLFMRKRALKVINHGRTIDDSPMARE
jgi:hypothetical protein